MENNNDEIINAYKSYFISNVNIKKLQISLKLYLVAGTGLEPVFAAANISPPIAML